MQLATMPDIFLVSCVEPGGVLDRQAEEFGTHEAIKVCICVNKTHIGRCEIKS
jgi:hypothetical protein